MVSEKKHPKNYVIVTSHISEVFNAPSYILIKMSSVGVVETYLYENLKEMSCLGAIFTRSIYDIAVMCYFGGVLTLPNKKIKNDVPFRCGLNSTIAELHGDVIGRCRVLSHNDVAFT